MRITTKTGMMLDSEKGMATALTNWARKKGIDNAMVFVVNDYETHLLVIDGKPEYESTQAEGIAVHIDIMAIAQKEE